MKMWKWAQKFTSSLYEEKLKIAQIKYEELEILRIFFIDFQA